MGRALLSASLGELLCDLGDITTNQTGRLKKKSIQYIKPLTDILKILDTVVDDAEEQQFTSERIKMWVEELQDHIYDLENHLLQIRTTGRPSLVRFFSKKSKKVGGPSLDELERRLKDLAGLGITDELSPGTQMETLQRLPSSSDVLENYLYGSHPKNCFYGRDEEQELILENLLSATAESDEHTKLINIVGKAGVGKTALADVIYFNHKVRESFELRAWVTVPNEANVTFIAKKILEAVNEEFVASKDYDLLWKRLQESFDGKKFLLVLDCMDRFNIQHIPGAYNSLGARGSAVVILSSSTWTGAGHTKPLGSLSMENSWSILSAHASSGQMDVSKSPELANLGRKMVNKMEGHPLGAKMVGSLLQDKLEVLEWVRILRNKFLHAGDVDIRLPSFLVLCYLDLPAQIKRCFAYLSLFPKGYQFKQKEVVLLWMAHGFLKETNGKSMEDIGDRKSMEDIGDEYFGYLIMRSFLEPFGSAVSFIMPNLVHDLACYAFGKSNRWSCYSNAFLSDDFKSLRIIFPFQFLTCRVNLMWSLENILMFNPGVLQVLSLSHEDFTELPTSIGKLIHLCYLDLSNTALEELPPGICDLLNLQTLLLTNCTSLSILPRKICNLIKLRHLDLRGSGVQEMPPKMHKLTSLQTLTNFIVSKSNPILKELAGLSNLKALTISKLQHVANAKDASYAKLRGNSIDNLQLQWGNNGSDSYGNKMGVLENLEPHKDLKRLTVEYYNGARFPDWLTDPSYPALSVVVLRHCANCTSLPTLGLLPFLKDLFIEGFTNVSSIGTEFSGKVTASWKPFRSLQFLHFQDMSQWEEWTMFEDIEFSCLIKLCIIRCPKLVGDLPKQLPSLEELEIIGCPELKAPLPEVCNACEVFVHESDEISKRNVVKSHPRASLRRVKASEEGHRITQQSKSALPSTSTTKEIEEIPHEAIMETQSMGSGLPLHSSSSDARITSGMLSHQFEADNPDIEQQTDPQSSMAKADIPITTQATLLALAGTPSTATPVKGETLLKEDLGDEQLSSQVLTVSNVAQLSSLPLKLHSLKIEGCEFLEVIPDDLLGGMTTLKELYLISCSSLTSLSYPDSLTTLYISNCRNLNPFSSKESGKRLVSLHHLFIGSSCDPIDALPLDSFPQLKTLCIWDWLNFQSFYFTRDQRVGLPLLESIEIRDCPTLRYFPDEGLHSPNLTSILLSNCENLKTLPKDLSSCASLKSLFLHRCPQIECFQSGGLPSSLVFLSIAYCNKLIPKKDWGLNNLESLSHFELEGGCMGMESFPEESLLPCNINALHISMLKSLKKLDYKGFQHLNALQTLGIYCCKMLRCLPDQGLPSSLEHLSIQECPLLTRRLKPMTGDEWHKVADIPDIQIDDQVPS